MYNPKNIKIASIVAIVLSIIGFLLSLIIMKVVNGAYFMSAISWAILLWASIIGYKLSNYSLYEDEYKRVGIRVYLIIASFVIFLFIGRVIGVIISLLLLSSLWGLKRNYDEWNNN
jgi:hypothetical protein